MNPKNVGIVLVTAFLAFILPIKILSITQPFLLIYSTSAVIYLSFTFIMALRYKPYPESSNYHPSISLLIPVLNEDEGSLKKTIRHAIEAEYDGFKEIVVVDDGSTNGIRSQLEELSSENVKVIFFSEHRGNKYARAEAIHNSKGKIVVFLDSDTYLKKNAVKKIVQPFQDKAVGAVCGHLFVHSANSFIAKLQSGWYYTSFRVFRAAEDTLDMVTCCTGAFSAYRRACITPEIINKWLYEKFLGLEVASGVDRALTSLILEKHKVKYQYDAQAYTVVPSTLKKFLKQQIRWTKSWIREGFYAASYLHTKGVKSLFFYTSFILHLANYVLLFKNLFWDLVTLQLPTITLFYVFSLGVVGLIYAIFARKQHHWQYRILFPMIYCWLALPLFLFSLLTINRKGWITR